MSILAAWNYEASNGLKIEDVSIRGSKKERFVRILTLTTLSVLAAFSLAACGGSTEERAATGGLGGAAAGAVVGGPAGAVVGGAAGATGGAVLDEGVDEKIEEAAD
jgi:hypothetical protein